MVSFSYDFNQFKLEKEELIKIEKTENSGYNEELKIRNQTWSKTNINISKLLDGRQITFCKSLQDIKIAFESKIPAYCYLNFDIENARFGEFYNYYVVFDSIGIAPKGWEIPSLSDFIYVTEAHGGIKNDNWEDILEYEFFECSFKSLISKEKNIKSTGFDSYNLGHFDVFSEYWLDGVADFWTNSKASPKSLKNTFYKGLSSNDVFIARFTENYVYDDFKDQYNFKSETLYFVSGSSFLMPLRLIKKL